jgi:hypothetical protein
MSTQPFNSDGGFSTTGNITGNLFVGNGSGLTGVTASANTGNVTFDNQAVVGTGDQVGSSGLYLAPGTESVGNLQYVRVRGGDVATHIHIDTGNNAYYDQYFGSDIKYVKLEAAGNVQIGSNDDTGNSAQWIFETSGTLTLPNGATIRDTVGNSVAFGNSAGNGQGNSAVAIGDNAGSEAQQDRAIAIGYAAGGTTQNEYAIAIGSGAGVDSQGSNTIAIGTSAGFDTQRNDAVAIGRETGAAAQGANAVAIGPLSGFYTQGASAIAIGFAAANTDQGNSAIAIGTNAGYTVQGQQAISIGIGAGEQYQGNLAVAIGGSAGANAQGISAVAIGPYAGNSAQNEYAIAIGSGAGFSNQGINAVAIGATAGATSQGANSVAIGGAAGAQGESTIAIGLSSGFSNQGNYAVAVGHTAGGNAQGQYAVAVGNSAGYQSQGQYAVAVGLDAGTNTQGSFAVAVGYAAGSVTQANSAIAVGSFAGAQSQGVNAVAIGIQSGYISQGLQAVAIGTLAGSNVQGNNSVAVGWNAGYQSQGSQAVAIGLYAGNSSQGQSAVAIGSNAGETDQGEFSVAVGRGAGNITQGEQAVSIGLQAGFTSQGNYAVAIGKFSANSSQGTYAVAVGPNAGMDNQLANAVAIGSSAGSNAQGINSVAVGAGAAYNTQGNSAVAVGNSAGYLLQGLNSVAIGDNAGFAFQGANSVAIGRLAGNTSQGVYAIAIGGSAATTSQGDYAVSMGYLAGANTQGTQAVAIGLQTGVTSQGAGAVALGTYSGRTGQGTFAVAIGYQAGNNLQANNSIILNATGSVLDQTTANTFTVAPVRNDVANIGEVVFYNATSKEITYGNVISVAGNITGGNITTGGTILGNSYTFSQSGAISAYATKRVLQYVPGTGAVTYSNNIDASSIYITGYAIEIHVSPSALNDDGNGTIGTPVKTIARAQVLAAEAFETTAPGQRNTIVLHPGDYAENVTISTQYTVLTTHELVGKNTTLSGTLTITKGCTIDGLKMTNLVISADDTTGTVDIIGCTVTTATTKTSSAYTVFRGCDLSTSTVGITGSGSTVFVGGNYFTLAVNNAAAGVLAKSVVTMGPVTLTAGTLQLSDSLIYAAANTANAITQSAGSIITVNNCQTLIPSLTNVARNSFGGFYSILNAVYDKANSTFAGTSLNAILYSQYINADNISATGNITGGNLNVTGNIVDTGALSIITGSNGNIALAPNGTGIVTVSSAASVTGNITGGNLAILGNSATITTANYSIGYLNIPQVSFAANATIALTDSGKHYYSTSASNLLLTIANNTSVSWTVGTAITIVNRGTANITIAQGTGVSLYLAGNSTSGNRTMTTYGMSTLMNVAANVWMINGTGVV